MKTIKIECDNCGKDITETGEMPAFRLHLSSEKLPQNSEMSYGVLVYREIGDEYYCNLACLKGRFTKQDNKK